MRGGRGGEQADANVRLKLRLAFFTVENFNRFIKDISSIFNDYWENSMNLSLKFVSVSL